MTRPSNPLIGLINTGRLILVLFVIGLLQLVDVDIIKMQLFGIGAATYATALAVLPFDKTRSKALGHLISLLDTVLICLFVDYSGEIGSPFLLLFIFPVISMAVLYGVRSALLVAVVMVTYAASQLTLAHYSPDVIRNLFFNGVLITFFALYLGTMARAVKGRERIADLERTLQEKADAAGA